MATTVNSVILPTTATTSIPAGLLNPNPTSIIRTFPPVSSDSRGSRSVSYFLGFLIALLAFLVFFVGCVIAARRGLLRRRRRDDEVGDRLLTTMTFSRVASHVTKPVLWEATFEKGSSRWESIMASASRGLFDKSNHVLSLTAAMCRRCSRRCGRRSRCTTIYSHADASAKLATATRTYASEHHTTFVDA